MATLSEVMEKAEANPVEAADAAEGFELEVMPSLDSACANELYLLAYARHMAKACRSPAARLMFESYAEQEIRRIKESAKRRERKGVAR